MRPLRPILIVLAVLDLAGIGGLWYGAILMQQEKKLEATLQEEKLSLDVAEDQLNRSKRMLLSTVAERESLAQFLFKATDEDQINFISRIERLGTSTSGAIVETVSLDASKPNVLSAEFSVKGTWSQIFHVLRLIEEFPARIVITRFDARGSGEGWVGTIKLDLLSIKTQPAQPKQK